MSTAIDLARLTAALTATSLVTRVVHLRETTSTQDVVRAAAIAGEPGGLLVLADHQTAGRGQFGRSWHDIAGDTLLCSLLLRPTDMQPAQTPALVLRLADALVAVLHAASPTETITVKHPNDVVVESPHGVRKLAGILAEGVANQSGQQWIALGFGININRNPAAVVDGKDLVATSAAVNDVVTQRFDRTSLLISLVQQFSMSD